MKQLKQYINKAALVAWIENQIDSLERNSGCSGIFGEYQMAVYDKLLSFIDTIEAKDVDLEKEATEFVQTKEFAESNESPVLLIAKYFFELGLKSQKGE